MELQDYKNLVQIIFSDTNHFDKFEKSDSNFKNERLNCLSKGDFLFRKILRKRKNDFIILKKKILVLGHKPKNIINGEIENIGIKKNIIKKNKLKNEISSLKKKFRSLKTLNENFGKKGGKKENLKKKINMLKKNEKLYLLNPKLEKDENSKKLLRLVKILQNQIIDSKQELKILENCIENSKKKNGDGEKLYNNFLENSENKNEIEIFEKKNENLKNLIESIKNENRALEKKNGEILLILKEEKNENINITHLNEKMEKNYEIDFEKEILFVEKRIFSMEENLKDLSTEDNFGGFENKEDIKNLEDLENMILEKKENLIQIDSNLKILKEKKNENLGKLEKLEKEEKDKNLEIEKKRLCLENDIDFFNMNFNRKKLKVENNFDNEKKEEVEKKIENVFLGDLGENFSKADLEILGLKKNIKKKGYYYHKIENTKNLTELQKKKI